MHRKFVEWLSQSWGRAAGCAALFGVLSLFGLLPFSIAAGAVAVLVALHGDARQGIRAALVGTICVSTLVLAARSSLLAATVHVVTLFWIPLWLGLLLKRYGSLTLCFQVAVLIACVGVGINYLVQADADSYFKNLVRDALLSVQQAGLELDDKQVSAMQSLASWGMFVTVLLLSALGSLFLGRWWHSLLDAPKQFGVEFRKLRLGRYLGLTAVVIVLTAVMSAVFGATWPVLDAWLWIAVVALAIQGLAVAHERKASGKWASGWLTAVYISLILPPLFMMVVAVLVGLGLADNWRQRGEMPS